MCFARGVDNFFYNPSIPLYLFVLIGRFSITIPNPVKVFRPPSKPLSCVRQCNGRYHFAMEHGSFLAVFPAPLTRPALPSQSFRHRRRSPHRVCPASRNSRESGNLAAAIRQCYNENRNRHRKHNKSLGIDIHPNGNPFVIRMENPREEDKEIGAKVEEARHGLFLLLCIN